ncbi:MULTISPECIES: PRC-barrel domain-containing protein [Streptomyces]|uniref:PRC-barrel domain-containing protein n=1 Tax=Streptomyces TaxID=1883 RepID=UPI00136DB33B|nr:PRC-barrel domain-containing protein [Streptomyces sp. SID5614]MZG04316.1 PRC-barrel domain containing protein [Streptomyces sp. SID5614]
MFEAENIRDWRDHDVVDAEGEKIGSLESIYVDTSTDQPAFAGVTIGLLTRKRIAFVPLHKAVVSPSYVKVAWSKKLVKEAPSIDTDGELLAEEEQGIFTHYGLEYGSGLGRRLARR